MTHARTHAPTRAPTHPRACVARLSFATPPQISNYGAYDCFFRVLQAFPEATVLIGSQRLAGRHQPPNSMLFISYYEMVHSLK